MSRQIQFILVLVFVSCICFLFMVFVVFCLSPFFFVFGINFSCFPIESNVLSYRVNAKGVRQSEHFLLRLHLLFLLPKGNLTFNPLSADRSNSGQLERMGKFVIIFVLVLI